MDTYFCIAKMNTRQKSMNMFHFLFMRKEWWILVHTMFFQILLYTRTGISSLSTIQINSHCVDFDCLLFFYRPGSPLIQAAMAQPGFRDAVYLVTRIVAFARNHPILFLEYNEICRSTCLWKSKPHQISSSFLPAYDTEVWKSSNIL